MNKLKSIINPVFLSIVGMGFPFFCAAQVSATEENNNQTDSTAVVNQEYMMATTDSLEQMSGVVRDSVPFEPFKIDGVAAVIGERLILESDIQKMYADLKSKGIPTSGITDCQLAERLMKNKLYAHQAIQDSIVVDDSKIQSMTNQRIDYFVDQLGSMEKMLEFYNMGSEAELRDKLFEITKEQELSKLMQEKVIKDVEITPEEVRTFFKNIPEDQRPKFGDEVEIAQIVIEPEVPQVEVQKVIDKLNSFRNEILAGESTFATKAVLYSNDPGTSSTGGAITLTRDSRFVQEFKDVAFSLQEGEISKPFKTEFGYHIIKVDKIRGQQIDVRHILLIPAVTKETIQAAKEKIDSIRGLIVSGKMQFSEAAQQFSDQKETREDGGKLINPTTGDTRFDQTKVDPSIYNQVVDLKEGQVSGVLTDNDRLGKLFYKIITVLHRYPAHIANYTQDFTKIKDLALTEKKLDVIDKWQEETIENTYIKINGKYRDCDFLTEWVKK